MDQNKEQLSPISNKKEQQHSASCKHDQEHDHKDGNGHAGHDHSHGGIFGENTELIFSLLCGLFLLAGFILSFTSVSSTVSLVLYIIAYFFGGFFTAKEAYETIIRGGFEIDFLMLVAAIGAAILGEWAEGALLLFLFSLGHALEHYAMGRATKSISALADLAPKTALIKKGDQLTEVPIEQLKLNDLILVKPGSKISADGLIVNGSGAINQAPITGESIPVDKVPYPETNISIEDAAKVDSKYRVFAGTINGSEALEIRVTKIASDSTISRLVRLVNESQKQKSPTQNFTDKLQKYYVPSVLILVVLLQFAFLVLNETYSESFYRSMAVLVAASPCALAISTPSAVLSGVARAARAGVLIKGGRPLEELGTLHAIAFDKTGTLTLGHPELTGLYPVTGVSEEELLETAIAAEMLSDHPLAKAIVKAGTEKLKKEIKPAGKLNSVSGFGISAVIGDATIRIGKAAFFEKEKGFAESGLTVRVKELEEKGNTTMIVQKADRFLGVLTVMDTLREDATQTVASLKDLGLKRLVMLTGDNQSVANAIAAQAGISEAFGSLLPEQKVAAIEKLKSDEKKVAMVGDGINDAPAMAKSSVGIAMGAAGSDVALETADIALMADKLSPLPFAIGLSKSASRIIRQNLFISLGMVVILIPLTLLGIAHIGPAVAAHEGSTLVVVLNALRLLAYKGR